MPSSSARWRWPRPAGAGAGTARQPNDALPLLLNEASQPALPGREFLRQRGSRSSAQRGQLRAGGLPCAEDAGADIARPGSTSRCCSPGAAQADRLRAPHPGPDGGARQSAAARIAWPGGAGGRFVNWSAGSGTRVLLDELLLQAGPGARPDQWLRAHEPSHAAVAQAIASGSADCGLAPRPPRARRAELRAAGAGERYLACLRRARGARLRQLRQPPQPGRSGSNRSRACRAMRPTPAAKIAVAAGSCSGGSWAPR